MVTSFSSGFELLWVLMVDTGSYGKFRVVSNSYD